MTMMSRRDLLISSSAVGLTTLARGAWAQAGDKPPVASVRPVTEHLHGATVTDPYRWMENPADPEWKPYLMGQNAYARRVLGSLKGRNELAARIDAVTGTMEPINAVQLAGSYVFVERRPAEANTFKLYVREGLSGADRLLVDPDRQATGSTHYSLDYWQASPDGRLVAFGTSPAGSEASVMRFVETATGKVLADSIDGVLWNAFTWSPDGSAVFVNRTKAGVKIGDIDRFLDSAVWRHRLGADPSTDTKVMARGLDPSVAMKDVGEPLVVAQAGQSTVLGIVENGVENELDVYVAQLSDALAGRPQWATVCKTTDGVTGVVMHRGDIYSLSHDKAPHCKVLKASLADPAVAEAQVVLPEGRSVLKSISAARDALYVSATDAGLGQVLRLLPDGSLTSLRLPFAGTVFGLRTDPLKDGCWFSLESWVKPPVICYGRPDGTVVITDIAPKPLIDVAPYESREVTMTARDGARVPLSIVYRKGVPRDGSAPLYLQAYGAYGLDFDPLFMTSFLPWLDVGGVLAVAHVRGGGELGQEWYKAGQLLTKPNTWRDCIDCAEYLIAEKWTSKTKLAVEGTSGGGVMVGRFLTERPDLLAVAVVRVGATNALRFEFEEAGPLNIPEFGTVADPIGFKALQEMDALSHVKDGVAYPAVILTTGVTDPRVAPWEAGKMAARLQAATSSRKPVLLRVETDAGHGVGSTRKQTAQERADIFAFILWQTGDKRFQP
jgi:prolyl oligopeptidase